MRSLAAVQGGDAASMCLWVRGVTPVRRSGKRKQSIGGEGVSNEVCRGALEAAPLGPSGLRGSTVGGFWRVPAFWPCPKRKAVYARVLVCRVLVCAEPRMLQSGSPCNTAVSCGVAVSCEVVELHLRAATDTFWDGWLYQTGCRGRGGTAVDLGAAWCVAAVQGRGSSPAVPWYLTLAAGM